MYSLNKIGSSHTHDKVFQIHRPTGSGDYVFICFHNEMIFIDDNQKHFIKAGSCILYTPDYPHQYYAANDYFTNDWLHFISKDDDAFINQIQFPVNQIIYPSRISELSSKIKEIELEKIEMKACYESAIDLHIKQLLLQVLREYSHLKLTKINQNLYDNLRYLRKQIYHDITKEWYIDDMAKVLNISHSYFQSIYKFMFGVSPTQDIINIRVERAKFYLSTSHYTVKEISMMVGYCNEYHFIRQFKSRTGLTPKQYALSSSISELM